MYGVQGKEDTLTHRLQRRWALTNPHLSLHIPSESRISRASGVKRNGAPKRPRPGMASVMSNIHLLLRVPSFDRWPLRMHLFVRAAHAAWRTSCAGAGEALREDVQVLTDLGSEEEASRPGTAASSSARTGKTTTAQTGDPEAEADGDSDERTAPWGIHSLALDYEPMKDHVEKGQSIVTFEREGRCIICDEEMEHGKGLHVVCSGSGCEGIGHLSCWSRHLLGQEGKDGTGGESEEALIPVRGRCPSCRDEVRWEDLMRELTLRMRGQKEVEKLLKTTTKRRRAKG